MLHLSRTLLVSVCEVGFDVYFVVCFPCLMSSYAKSAGFPDQRPSLLNFKEVFRLYFYVVDGVNHILTRQMSWQYFLLRMLYVCQSKFD